MLTERVDSDLLRYIVGNGFRPGDRLPSLEDLSEELKISIGKLREQLEVARSLGLVEVRPRTGIRLMDYSFLPAVRFSLMYALACDPSHFERYGQLRNQIESCFWHEAVALLQPSDHDHLRELVRMAWRKLEGSPIQIPHAEHRELHMTIFSRLDNPYVKGLLEAYWEAYEAVGLSVYSDYQYLREVWTHHEGIVAAIASGNPDRGHELLVRHSALLHYRTPAGAATRAEEPMPAGSKHASDHPA